MDEYHPGIVDRFPLCMALLDRDLVIRAWNRCMEELVRRPAASAVGQLLRHLPEFKGLPIRTAIRRLLEGEGAVHIMPRGGRNDRGPLAAGLSLAPLRGPAGAVSGFLMTISRPPVSRGIPHSAQRTKALESPRWRVGRTGPNREAGRLALLGAVSELAREAWEEPGLMLQGILDLLATEVAEEALVIFGVVPGGGGLTLLASRGLSPEAASGLPAAAAEGSLGQLLRQGLPVFQASADPAEGFLSRGTGLTIRSLVAVPVRSRERLAAALCCVGSRPSPPFGDAERAFFAALASLIGQALERQPLAASLTRGVFDTVQALAVAIEAKDPYTKGHVQRVTQYAVALGEELDLTPGEIRTLQFWATLHDIGKIGIRAEVLNKPGALSEPERAHMRSHPIVGEQIIAEVDFLQEVRPCIRHHQERYDGSGYPDGLQGEAIPLLARIIAVADVFDALTTDRPYRPALPAERALALLQEEAGQAYDPKVVEALCRMLR